MQQAYIIDGLRTPFANFRGSLSSIRTDDLLAFIIRKLIDKYPDLPLEAIEDVIIGCANQAGEDNRNVARMSVLLSGLPYTIPGETINRLCASGMSAVISASKSINAGIGDLFLAGGVEHMTRSPMVLSKSNQPFGGDSELFDSSFGWRFVNPKMNALYGTDAMGNTAENLVAKYGISREDQDLFAFRSQMKAALAQKNGRLAREICPIPIPQRKGNDIVFADDEFIKSSTTLEVLSKLRPAFKKNGTVTAGNASGLNDGAAITLIASEDAVVRYNLKPIAQIISSAVVGVEPRIMGIGPVGATLKALNRAGLTLDQIGVIELNEAFAAQALACTRALGLSDDDPRINPNGGAIAIGHPLGVSGTRILHSLALSLHDSNQEYGLATMCIGVGQGYATIIKKV